MKFRAVFRNGALLPLEEVELAEGATVRVEVCSIEERPSAAPVSYFETLGQRSVTYIAPDLKQIPEEFDPYLP